jgi:signal transduction histidine kinase/ligand-binding sensor domain-containing protein
MAKYTNLLHVSPNCRMTKTIFIFLALPLCLAVNAQSSGRFTNYGVNEGLPQSSIYDISQDKNGFIWIGTAGGLCRFDGYQFKVYKTSEKDKNAIPAYKEFRFYHDNNGKMWITSFNGVSVYNALTDDFTNVIVYKPKNVVIAENHFFGEDKDFIWIGLCSYGIVKIHKQTLKVYTTPLTKTTFRPGNNVGYNGFLENGKLWILDNNESINHIFYRYDTQTQATDTITIPLTGLINLNDSEALGMNLKSAVIINKKTLAYKSVPVMGNGADHSSISIYRQSASEAILCSPTHGLFYLDTRAQKITGHIAFTDPETRLSALFARCLYKDRSGNTWVGTRGEGVYKMSYHFKNFRSYRSVLSKNQNVFGMYVDEKTLYAGFLTQGLTKFSRINDSPENIIINKNFPLALNNAYTMTGLGKDKLLIMATSSVNNGYNLPFAYTKATGKIELLDKEVVKVFADLWGRGNLRHFIFKDEKANYLTNIGEYLVALHASGDGKLYPEILNRFTGEALTCGFKDRDGGLWVGSYTGVFYRNKTGWKKVNTPQSKEAKCISQDPDGNLWMGTNDEIFILNKEHQVIKRYTEDDGLINAHVYSILKDDDGNMWFSHNKGLTVYHWKEKKFEHFDRTDGLGSSEFNVGACYKADDGEMFFGGINGITAFYPREILHNPNTPAVQITGIKVFDEPYQTDIAYWNIRKIELPYTENSLSFEFVLPEYTNQARNTYQYMMVGVDDKWINGGDRRFTRYPGLRSGHYTFKVKGSNNDGVFGNETTIAIYIVPPFWQSVWFIVLMILAFILLSVGVGILIQKSRQKKAIRALELQHKIQLERERISRDLHDNVGTQLSLISKNIEGVINPLQNVSDAERIRNLSSISQTSKEVIFTLRETIWALNKEEISLEELSDKLKGFTQKLFEINSTCRLLFSEDIADDAAVLSPSEAIHLFRICQEAITNSLKYANASTMEITISSIDNRYEIVIADNGIGFAKEIKKESAHYGLENMKYRAGEINCDFTIDSAPGEGTRITISKK